MNSKGRFATIGKLLEKCEARGILSEKAIADISIKDFYDLSQTLTKQEAALFVELQDAIREKTLFAYFTRE